MNETGFEYDLLATFLAVAEEQSFTKAATKRGVSKGTVSRAIARLEEQLGAQLLHRNTHAVALSAAGAELRGRIASHFVAVDDAVRALPERAAERRQGSNCDS